MRQIVLSRKLRAALAGVGVAALAAVASASAASAVGSDLQLSLSAPAQAQVGDTITFVAEVRNNGPDRATSVRLTGQIPLQGQLVSAKASQGTCAGMARPIASEPNQPAPIQCFVGPLGAGEQARVTLVLKATGAGVATVSADVTSDQADPNLANNHATLTTTVGQAAVMGADLQLSLAARSQARQGSRITYFARVRNAGPGRATSVKLTDQLPAQARLLHVDAPRGACGSSVTSTGASSSGSLTCSLGSLASGAETHVTIVVRAIAVGSLVNTASVSAAETDPNTQNNQAQATTNVVARGTSTGGVATAPTTGADLSVDLSGPRHVRVGKLFRVVVHVHNRGPETATSVKVDSDLSRSVRLIAVRSTQGDCSAGAATAATAAAKAGVAATAAGTAATAATAAGKAEVATTDCSLGTLAPGGSASVAIVVRVRSRGHLTVDATVSADQADPRASNNHASLTTRVSGRHAAHQEHHGRKHDRDHGQKARAEHDNN